MIRHAAVGDGRLLGSRSIRAAVALVRLRKTRTQAHLLRPPREQCGPLRAKPTVGAIERSSVLRPLQHGVPTRIMDQPRRLASAAATRNQEDSAVISHHDHRYSTAATRDVTCLSCLPIPACTSKRSPVGYAPSRVSRGRPGLHRQDRGRADRARARRSAAARRARAVHARWRAAIAAHLRRCRARPITTQSVTRSADGSSGRALVSREGRANAACERVRTVIEQTGLRQLRRPTCAFGNDQHEHLPEHAAPAAQLARLDAPWRPAPSAGECAIPATPRC